MYKSYQHIEKLGSSEVEGILNGRCYLTYKIDGSNGCIFLNEDNTLGFGSRKRELSLERDNANFMLTIISNKELYNQILNYLLKNPSYIIYGEWLVPHTIKYYKMDAWDKFYVFDIFDCVTRKYLNYDFCKKELEDNVPLLQMIPTIDVVENPTEEYITSLLDKTGDFLIEDGIGEGIVIKNYDYVNKYGRTTWAKILTEDFRTTKKRIKANNANAKEEFPIEHVIITTYLKKEAVLKEYNKMVEVYGGFESKNIFELLNRVFIQ